MDCHQISKIMYLKDLATKTAKIEVSGSIAIPQKNESLIFLLSNEPKIIEIGPVFQKIEIQT